jgi:hypothetical protein
MVTCPIPPVEIDGTACCVSMVPGVFRADVPTFTVVAVVVLAVSSPVDVVAAAANICIALVIDGS